jgi:hypothetical protein
MHIQKYWGSNCSKFYILVLSVMLTPYRLDDAVDIPSSSTDFLPRDLVSRETLGHTEGKNTHSGKLVIRHHPLPRFTNPSESSTLKKK